MNYPPTLRELIGGKPVQPLGAGAPCKDKQAALKALTLANAFAPHPVRDADMARACLSGLWLAYNFLDESHCISQEVETREGSFWHAIMHRREPDAANAKYWWRRVGSHSVIDELLKQAPALGYRYTSPFDFVDFCERARGAGDEDEELAQRVQMLEWQLLFDYCLQGAVDESLSRARSGAE